MKIESNHPHQPRPMIWRTPIAAAVMAVAMALSATDAAALALGRPNVLSMLGEPLRVEIEVPEINAEELASLRVNIAAPDAFRAAGFEYNAALSIAQVSLQRSNNGKTYILVTSARPVNDPFVDLIIEANWGSGRVVRDYTLLLDPPHLRAQAPATPALSGNTAPAASPMASAPSATPPAKAGSANAAARAPRAAATKPALPPVDGQGVTVKAGDTAASLAARHKPEGISLEQMLVAMLHTNPEAFVNNNANRLRAGAVLDMHSAASAAPDTSPTEAQQTIHAQARDFNEFRRRLASGTAVATTSTDSRTAKGQVQAQVQDKKPQSGTNDQLTLSKGAVSGKKEESIAKDKQAKEAASRVAELSKNINDLNKIGTTTSATAGSTKPAASAPSAGVGLKVPAPVAVASPPPAAPASASSVPKSAASAPAAATTTAPATSTAATASAPASTATSPVAPTGTSTIAAATSTTATAAVTATTATAAAPAPKKPSPPPPEPSFVEGLTDNPMTLPAAGGLLAVLAGLGFWRLRQRKKTAAVDSSFLESRLQPDSFFGASGGQRVDTAESVSNAGSSMVYSPSQLDAAGDVDPVAEADVYLAYGRDLQAEEILKEAMRTNPRRAAIHVKLLEIYAKRRDIRSFDAVAKEAYTVTRASGPEWGVICTMGQELDPENPLYRMANGSGAGSAAAHAAVAFAASTIPQEMHSVSPTEAGDVDFDLDLDFSGDALVEANGDPDIPVMSSPLNDTVKMSAVELTSYEQAPPYNSEEKPTIAAPLNTRPMTPASMSSALDMPHDFDLGDLSLDLPGIAPDDNVLASLDAAVTGDPLETKLALAHEFKDIGDLDGARTLAMEVVQEATGSLKTRAQNMVADLS